MLKLLETLNQSSLFELFQLKSMINKMLDDPTRIQEIRQKISLQQEITYFEATLNQEIAATIIEIKRTTVTVQNHDDGKRWVLPMYMLNLTGIQTEVKKQHNKVDRLTLRVGDSVGFINRRTNLELYGIVVKLNQKTASVKISNDAHGQTWRVSYSLLFYVIDALEGFLALP